MVGIVIVSHSKRLAEGVVEISRMMAKNSLIEAAGGLENGDLGTSYEKISSAIEKIYSDDGVIVLMDIGSAVLTTEMVLEDLNRPNVRMIDCPLVEGAVLAAVEASGGHSIDEIANILEKSRSIKKF